MTRNLRRKRAAGVALALLLISVPAILVVSTTVRPAEAASVLSIGRTSSGLVTSDPLTTGNTALWTFGGSADVLGAPATYSEDQSGLHLGVQSNIGGQWAGYYAARGEQAQLFHSTLSLPSTTLQANQSFNTGLYVQTGGTDVDYVTCAGGVDNGGYFWAVVQATGNEYGATQFNTLWFEWMNNQPLNRSCTIVTNGANILTVYLDGALVFSSTSMNLGYQSPFTTFLEVQTTDNTTMHFSTYTDYYASTSGTVTVNGAPPGSTVQIVDSSGNVLASGAAGLTGTATMDIASYNMPLSGNVRALSLGQVVASTPSPVQIYGGDTYSVGVAPGTGTTSLPYTSNPGTTSTFNTNLGQGIALDLALPTSGSSSGGVCILGLCL